MLPLARKEGLRVEELSDELMVYDVDRHKAHCLSPIAALVWRHCDGQKTIEEISAVLRSSGVRVDEEMVWTALHRLEKRDLLQEKIVLPKNAILSSRRNLMRKILAAGGVYAVLTTTIFAPTPARAKSGDRGHEDNHDQNENRQNDDGQGENDQG